MQWNRAWRLIKSDLARRVSYQGDQPGLLSSLKALFSPPGMAVAIHRLHHYCHKNDYSFLGRVCALLNTGLFAVEIGPAAEIGEGLLLLDPNGVAISDHVRIGRNCVLIHQCAITVPEEIDRAYIGNYVVIGPGARLGGRNLHIGDHCRIGANAVVTDSIPSYSAVSGIPARVVGRVDPRSFALEPPLRGRVRGSSLRATWQLIRADLRQRALVDGPAFSWLNPRALAVVLFRAQAWVAGTRAHPLARPLADLNQLLFKVRIRSDAQIDGGLVLANCVSILGRARIGRNCLFFHHNTLCSDPLGNFTTGQRIILDDDVIVGMGARITGDVMVGRGSLLGANSSVTCDILPQSIAAGVPALPVRTLTALTEVAPNKSNAVPVAWPSFREMVSLVREDMQQRAHIEGRPFGWLSLPFTPAALVVASYRLQCWLHGVHLGAVARPLASAGMTLFTTEIQCGAEIGGGLYLAHANGILISDRAQLGKRVRITLQSSITCGPRSKWDAARDRVRVGDDVFVKMGARIVGNLTVGANSVIGMNAVVTRSAPPRSFLVGAPARDPRPFMRDTLHIANRAK